MRDRGAPEPLPLRWLAENGIERLTPWFIITDESERAGLRRQYRLETSGGSQPIGDCYPFARRDDCDDIAAFVVKDGDVGTEVVVAHLTWRDGAEIAGFPGLAKYRDFWDWFGQAVRDSREWASDDLLDDAKREAPPVAPPPASSPAPAPEYDTADLKAFLTRVLQAPPPALDHPYLRDDVIDLTANRLARRDPDWLRSTLSDPSYPRETRELVRRMISPPLTDGT